MLSHSAIFNGRFELPEKPSRKHEREKTRKKRCVFDFLDSSRILRGFLASCFRGQEVTDIKEQWSGGMMGSFKT
jgi:hypothetical protein